MPRDIEDSVQVTYVTGFPSLAAFIASDPDKSSFVFRRFDRLTARNLLYLQSELLELEKYQDELDEADRLSNNVEDKRGSRNWHTLKTRAKELHNVREKERIKLVQDIRVKLKEYQEAMVLEATLLSLRRPSPQTYKAFKNHFHNVDSHGEPTLGGLDATILDDRDDLLALVRPAEEDRLTKFLRVHFPVLFLAKRPSAHSSIAYVSRNRIRIVVGVINILLAAILLFGAIYTLYYVKSDRKRLGFIAGYTVAFALCMGLLSGARRSEIFGACAAYAAVLVVFVSGNLGSRNG